MAANAEPSGSDGDCQVHHYLPGGAGCCPRDKLQTLLLVLVNNWPLFRLDALALSVIATATWLAGWLGGWVGGCLSQPVLYQND